jgi:hypothetical protein
MVATEKIWMCSKFKTIPRFRRRLRTILDQFRNTHARLLEPVKPLELMLACEPLCVSTQP